MYPADGIAGTVRGTRPGREKPYREGRGKWSKSCCRATRGSSDCALSPAAGNAPVRAPQSPRSLWFRRDGTGHRNPYKRRRSGSLFSCGAVLFERGPGAWRRIASIVVAHERGCGQGRATNPLTCRQRGAILNLNGRTSPVCFGWVARPAPARSGPPKPSKLSRRTHYAHQSLVCQTAARQSTVC